jgi:syntenin-1
MSLYPSIESLTVDAMKAAQVQTALHAHQAAQGAAHGGPAPSYPPQSDSAQALSLYGALYSELGLDDYMGMSLSSQSRQLAVPEGTSAVVAHALPQELAGLKKAEVTHGVRPVVLCKDSEKKMGLAVKAVNKGVFISCVWARSPAALAGLRVGDQILQIDGESVAGFSSDKALKRLKQCSVDRVCLIVRDRPFQRTITLNKDSQGNCGFVFKNLVVTAICKDTSAARNGLTTSHNILEVDGQNVIGLKDKDVLELIHAAGTAVTFTIMPSVIYKEMEKNLSSGMRKNMDHSIPPDW